MKNLCFGLVLLAAAGAAAAQPPAPYVLDNTEVREVRAPALKRGYQVFVALPDSYREDRNLARRYPVVFVTDANYAFPIVRGMEAAVGEGDGERVEFRKGGVRAEDAGMNDGQQQ